MLQRQIMLKQLQEMQQQQQLQELGGLRQQNYINQLPYLNKQTSGGLHPSLVPVHEAPQKFMVGNTHLMQRGTSPLIQGFPNGFVFSQAQSPAVSMGMLPQQAEVSLYGTPISSSGNNFNQYSHLQGVSHDSTNMFGRGNNNQMDLPVVQPLAVSNPFMNEQCNTSQEKVCMSDGTFSPKYVFQDSNMLGQVLMPASNDVVPPFNFQQVHSHQKSASMKESDMRQEQACWPVIPAGRTPKVDSPQGTSLDPLEEKILFNTDDDSWKSALGGEGNTAAGGLGNGREHLDFMGTFSSTQSGSWSALMQSAVAEASSSDTGQQEEWSGLTFQNPDLSADNQPTNYLGSGKQQNGWADNNLQCVSSPTSEPEIQFHNSNPSFSFPGFQQSNYLAAAKQSDGMHSESSHESIQHSPENARKWHDSNSQQKQPIEECRLVQTSSPLHRMWRDQQFEHSEKDGHQPNISSYANDSQSCHNIAGQALKKNVWLHPSGCQPMVGQKASDQAANSLGNQDGDAGQVKFSRNVSNVMMNSQKANTQRNSRPSEETPPRNTVDSFAALFGSSTAFCGQNIAGNTIDNVFDMLNKTGKSEEQRTGTSLGCRDSIPASQVSRIGPSDDQQYFKNSSAQGSGSALGHQPNEVNYGTMFTTGPSYMGNHLQNQQQPVAPMTSQSPNAAFPGINSKFQANVASPRDASNQFQTSTRDQLFPTLDSMQVTHPSLMSCVPQHIGRSVGLPNMSTIIPSPLHGLQPEMPKVLSSSLPSPDSTNSNVEAAIGASNEQHRQNSFQTSSLRITTHHQALDRAQQRENDTPKFSERQLEALAYSLRPPQGNQQDFSLLHQVNYLKNLEASNSNKMLTKSSEADSGLVSQHADANARQLLYMQKLGIGNLVRELNTKPQLNSFSSGDNARLSCSSDAGGNQLVNNSAKCFIQDNQGNVPSSHTDSHMRSKDESNINVQMAPSWFKHYGTWKNGQMLPMYDAKGLMDAGRQFPIRRSFEHIGQVYNANASEQSVPSLPANQVIPKQLEAPFMSPAGNSEQNLAVLTPKKRKVAQYESLPWHKEVNQGFQQFQKASRMAGIEWASSTNQLCEKVEGEAEVYDDMLPVPRAKRRLVLTTGLMQQVFRPLPAVLLSADAYSNYKSIIYFVCRLALGDACSVNSGSHTVVLDNDMSSEKLNSDKVGEEDVSRTVENFIARTKMVESCVLRLDKTSSILDIKVECQELEKYSVINRFAKFHSRAYTVSVDASSSSGAVHSLQKPPAQRHIVPHPMPQVVPESTNCLSL